jgi:hypothetical protein
LDLLHRTIPGFPIFEERKVNLMEKRIKTIHAHTMMVADCQGCMEVSGQYHASSGFFTPEN